MSDLLKHFHVHPRTDGTGQRAEVAELEHALDAEVAAGLAIPEDIRDLVEGDEVTWVS